MLKMIFATFLLISTSAMAAQQTHFACKVGETAVITVQEDAAGSISLTRTESEQVSALGMTAMNQKQILIVNARDVAITSDATGDSKQINLKFYGPNGADSQLQMQIKTVLFGHVEEIDISGTGAALERVQKMIDASEQGINFHGCRIEVAR